MSATTDKSQAIITFLQTYDDIKNNALFFNFGNVEDNAHQTNIEADDVALHKPYVDGSVLKRFTFTLDSFKAVNYNSIVDGTLNEYLTNENIEEFESVQALLDWINDQNKLRNFPDFGDKCFIEQMKTLSNKPKLAGVDATLNPPVAIYKISIQIDYVDKTDCLWQ